jgi:CheY-like chemotaxis protein
MEAERCDLLIVDDEPCIRRFLELYFERMIPGIKIKSAKDGEEGYRLASEFRPRIIWTCIRMPRIGGLELIKLIKKNPDIRDAKVIIYTAYGSKEVRDQAFELGADAFIDKPGKLEEMLATVANFLYDDSR